jgi:Glyoxalase-like domain
VTLAAVKDLCIDARDPERMARFWAAVLRLEIGERRDDVVRLDGPTPQDRVWVNAVPEPRTGKNRLHLDVHAGSVEEIVLLGANVLDDTLPWTLLADPDGGEFCVFVRDEPPPRRLYELVLDARDPEATARWWAGLLGGRLEPGAEGSWAIGEISEAPFEWFCVNATAEPKSGKNRVHLDVVTEDVGRVLAHGARLVRARDTEISWDVLADPEGNEFCAFPR